MGRVGPSEIVVSILITIAVLVVIFLLLREFVCWYYKINKRIELQQETIRLLGKLIELNTPKGDAVSGAQEIKTPSSPSK
jgi:hypothetical protein